MPPAAVSSAAGATAGALLGNVVGGAKALLGGLVGAFDTEGASDKSTGAVTGVDTCW